MKNSENRYLTEQSNLRAFIEDDKRVIEGRALIFNSESRWLNEDNKTFKEVIEPGALNETDFSRAYLTYNHSKDDVFATVRGKSLSPISDDNGMLFRAVLNNTQKANDMYELVSNGDMAGLSFNMIVNEQDYKYSRGSDGILKRTIHKIRAIREISLVGGLFEPAYPDTKVWARGLDEFVEQEEKQTKEQIEAEQALEKEKTAQRHRFTNVRTDIYKENN
jgi:HK97 family phage prohead protease